jgi:hypothetical protein
MNRRNLAQRLPLVVALACALVAVGCTRTALPATTTTRPATTTTSRPTTTRFIPTSCEVGTYSLENEDGDAPNSLQAGERVTVEDNWGDQQVVEITGFVVVFYENGTEVGSVAVGPQEGFWSWPSNIDPVYLTYQQSQTWTLVAGWTGTANSCTVVKVTSTPQVPAADQF